MSGFSWRISMYPAHARYVSSSRRQLPWRYSWFLSLCRATSYVILKNMTAIFFWISPYPISAKITFKPQLMLTMFLVWRNSPTRARATSILTFLDHTQWHTSVGKTLWMGDRPVAETSIGQHTTLTSRTPAGFETSVAPIVWPQILALDLLANWITKYNLLN